MVSGDGETVMVNVDAIMVASSLGWEDRSNANCCGDGFSFGHKFLLQTITIDSSYRLMEIFGK